jgi:hypothetical protein
MATTEDIMTVFRVLEAAGIRHSASRDDDDPTRAYQKLQESAAVYVVVFADVPAEDLEIALHAWLRRDSPYWPTPGQLFVLTPRERLRGVEDDGGQAWADVKEWCHRHAPRSDGPGYREPTAGQLDAKDERRDAAMRAALREIGGVAPYMNGDVSDEPFRAKRFREAFRRNRDLAERSAELLSLPAPDDLLRKLGLGRLLGDRKKNPKD